MHVQVIQENLKATDLARVSVDIKSGKWAVNRNVDGERNRGNALRTQQAAAASSSSGTSLKGMRRLLSRKGSAHRRGLEGRPGLVGGRSWG